MKYTLNKIQKEFVIKICSHAVAESTLHMRRLISTGGHLFTRAGTKVTLKKAVKRRKRCIRLTKLALEGYIT